MPTCTAEPQGNGVLVRSMGKGVGAVGCARLGICMFGVYMSAECEHTHTHIHKSNVRAFLPPCKRRGCCACDCRARFRVIFGNAQININSTLCGSVGCGSSSSDSDD